MRVRLQTLPPLQSLKAWYEIPVSLLSGSSTIEHLKDDICDRFLKQQTTGDIVFEVESYEILNDSTITVLRENDLILIKYRPSSLAGSKRKRDSPASSPAATKTTKARSPSISSSSSDSTSSSSSSPSSSSPGSASSISTSSSSSAPKSAMGIRQLISIKPTHPLSNGFEPQIDTPTGDHFLPRPDEKKSQTLQSLADGMQSKAALRNAAPPGHGKPSTQKRNQRRKKKRLAEQGLIDGNTHSPLVASIDGGFKEDALSTSMYKLKNENKRKGFKKDMKNSVPGHQMFESSQLSSPKKRAARFIPPSQQTNLPRNIFVTSVDVEAVEWESGSNSPTNEAVVADMSEALVPQDFVPTQRTLSDDVSGVIRWKSLDQRWETYPVATMDHVTVGKTFLWKDLTLNPVTLTPEISVQAGRIVSIGEMEFTLAVIQEDGAEMMESETEFTRHFLELENFRLYN